MKSMKSIVISILIVVIIGLSGLVIFNQTTAGQVQSEAKEVEKLLGQLELDYREMNLPIRVLLNIKTQLGQENISESLQQAYIDNSARLINRTRSFQDGLDRLEQKLSTYRMFKGRTVKSVSNDLLINVSLLQKQVDKIIMLEDTSLPASFPDALDEIALLHELYLDVEEPLLALEGDYRTIVDVAVGGYISLLSGTLLVVLLIIIFVSFMILKLLLVDMRFIIKGFSLMARREYDHNQLPNMKVLFEEEKKIKGLVEDIITEQAFVADIRDIVSQGYVMDEILEELFELISSRLYIDRLGIAFVDYEARKFVAEFGVMNYGEVLLGPGFTVPFEETTLTEVVYSRKPKISNNLHAELKERSNSASLKLLQKEGINSNMIVPIIMNKTVVAVLFFSSVLVNAFSEKELSIASKITKEVGALIEKSYLTKIIFSNTMTTFSELVDRKDNETGGHIKRMVRYSTLLASKLVNHPDEMYRVDKSFVKEIERNAAVHDIGKVGIPDEILKKPGKLTPEEWEIMKTHAKIGGEIFDGLQHSLSGFNREFYKVTTEIAMYHHERWDGSGYPDGLREHDIPLAARIVAVSDVFDALTSKRVYKDAFSLEKTIEILEDSKGSHLDPVLVDLFLGDLEGVKRILNSK